MTAVVRGAGWSAGAVHQAGSAPASPSARYLVFSTKVAVLLGVNWTVNNLLRDLEAVAPVIHSDLDRVLRVRLVYRWEEVMGDLSHLLEGHTVAARSSPAPVWSAVRAGIPACSSAPGAVDLPGLWKGCFLWTLCFCPFSPRALSGVPTEMTNRSFSHFRMLCMWDGKWIPSL